MPGFNPQQEVNQARSGNTVSILVGQQLVAFAQTTSPSINFGAEQLYGIGSSKPQEIQQLRMSPSFSLDNFALTATGIRLLSGGQNLAYILAGTQFDIHVFDGIANTTLFTYVGCKAMSFAESIPTNGIIRDAYAFLAMDVLDANGNSIMDTHDNALAVAAPLASAGAVAGALGLSA